MRTGPTGTMRSSGIVPVPFTRCTVIPDFALYAVMFTVPGASVINGRFEDDSHALEYPTCLSFEPPNASACATRSSHKASRLRADAP